MIGMRKVISTNRLKMKKILPIILGGRLMDAEFKGDLISGM
jgi:hypothetical protein